MDRRILTSFLILVLAHYFMGCAIYSDSDGVDLKSSNHEISKIYSVVLTSGNLVKFNEEGARYYAELRLVKGISESGVALEIPVSDIMSANIREADALLTAALYLGIIGIVVFAGSFFPNYHGGLR